jgi:hypothetical protein
MDGLFYLPAEIKKYSIEFVNALLINNPKYYF